MQSSFTYSIKTLGCKANIFDSMVLEHGLQELGGTPSSLTSENAPEVCIINSCTVTAEADKQSLYEAARAKKKSSTTTVIYTGCSAEIAAPKLKENLNLDFVISNQNKHRILDMVALKFGLTPVEKPTQDPEIFWGQLPSLQGKTRAFLKIQEGCNDFCTYCIIPYARGKSRSVAMEKILAEIQRLVFLGTQEIVITGTNIADYGFEFGSCLEALLEAILLKTSVPRIRLTSLDPTEITDRLLELMKNNSRLMPHFHVSLQSAVSRVLRAMKRKYRQEDVISCLNKIHKADPEIFVGMDLIAGFPTETDEEHKEAVQLLSNLPWTRLHVFPYSEREGTPALNLPNSVPHEIRKKRAQELMNLSHLRHRSFVEIFLNRKIDGVLYETLHSTDEGHFLVGHAPNYLRVMAQVQESDAKSFLRTIGSCSVTTALPKPTQDWTLEGIFKTPASVVSTQSHCHS